MDWQGRGAEGGCRAAVRRGVVGNLMVEVAPYTAASCCRRSQSAHFRAHAHAPITGDGKLRKSTYVIDPASWQREGPGDVWEANGEAVVAGFPGYFLSCCRACSVPGRAVVLLLHRSEAEAQIDLALRQAPITITARSAVEWTVDVGAGGWRCFSRSAREGQAIRGAGAGADAGAGAGAGAVQRPRDLTVSRAGGSTAAKTVAKGVESRASRFSGAKLPWMGCAK